MTAEDTAYSLETSLRGGVADEAISTTAREIASRSLH